MTQDNAKWLIDVLFVVIFAGISWWNATMWSELKDLRRRQHDQNNEINKLNILVVGNYVTRPELEHQMSKLTETLNRGFEKMDKHMAELYTELKHKADKP